MSLLDGSSIRSFINVTFHILFLISNSCDVVVRIPGSYPGGPCSIPRIWADHRFIRITIEILFTFQPQTTDGYILFLIRMYMVFILLFKFRCRGIHMIQWLEYLSITQVVRVQIPQSSLTGDVFELLQKFCLFFNCWLEMKQLELKVEGSMKYRGKDRTMSFL